MNIPSNTVLYICYHSLVTNTTVRNAVKIQTEQHRESKRLFKGYPSPKRTCR